VWIFRQGSRTKRSKLLGCYEANLSNNCVATNAQILGGMPLLTASFRDISRPLVVICN